MSELMAQMRTPKEEYTVDYPIAIEAARLQFKMAWPGEEIGVYKDEQDIRVKATPGERHGLTEMMRIFTDYELRLGQEFWSGKYSEMFPRPDLRRAANAFAFTELNSHAPFYDEINKVMGIATDDFYSSWKKDPVLVERIKFIDDHLNSTDPYACLAAFSFMEGTVLYSNFAFLKSFNRDGRNMIPHITAGIDSSAKEEHQHFLFSSWSFRNLMEEETKLGLFDPKYQKPALEELCKAMALTVYDHECQIIEIIFSKGGIRHITKEMIKHFIRDRINIVLKGLGFAAIYDQEPGVVSGWFYSALSSYKYSDSFAATQLQYSRNWVLSDLGWPAGDNA